MQELDVKKKILSNATKLFAENGFSKTSIQKIADASNTSQTNVLYHFKTKKRMFEECLRMAISKNRKLLKSHTKASDKENLLFLLNTNVRWASESPQDCQLFLLLYYFSSNDDYFLKLSSEIVNDGLKLLNEYLDPFTFRPGFTKQSSAFLLQSYIHGIMFNIVAHRTCDFKVNYEKSIDAFLHSLIED